MTTRLQKIVFTMMVSAYFVFAISTFMGAEFAIELFSAITAWLTGILILVCIENIEVFYISSILLSIGIFSWALSDTIRFVNHYILGVEPLSYVVRTLYLLPNYFFAMALLVYMMKKLKGRRRELSYLMANAFCVSGIGFVLIGKLLNIIASGNEVTRSSTIRAMLYFLVNFFVILLIIHLIRMVEGESLKRGSNLLPLGILCYILIDIQYNLKEASGQEPENIYTNLLYMLFMIMMAVGIMIQNKKQYVYFFGVTDFSAKTIRRRVAYTFVVVLVDLGAWVTGCLKLNEALYIVILLMAYMIMTYISRSDMLSETLLEQQMQQNEILEDKVLEKTRELKEANEYLEKLSSTDLLTGLYNRRYGYDYLDRLHGECKENGRGYTIFCIDLNGFKPINDTYGHEMGDRVLKVFAERMLSLPERYIAVRTGGDEFMLIMKRGEDEESIEKEASSLRDMFHTPIFMDTYEFNLSASIGAASFPEDAGDTTTLIQYADEAMYIIKHSGHKDGYKLFDSSLVTDVVRNEKIKKRIESADPEKEFVLRYQPQYDVSRDKLVGVEVFPHLKEEDGDVSPSVLVPLAEELGLMNPLGIWITRTAMKQVSDWNRELGRELMLTINLSPLQIVDNDYIEFLEHIGEDYNISNSMITLDVDNEVIMGSVESAKATLIRLRKQGFNLSLNNFGGGDINLSYILECGFNGLKLSRTVVSDIGDNPMSLELIRLIKAMADSMNVAVTAVGIENEEHLSKVLELGIETMQGFYFGKPVTAKEFKLQKVAEKS